MILKGSQRANGSDLAVHLMNSFDNERVDIAEVSGTVARDLLGAFAEFEAVALGTRAQNYLYSLSINPPEPLTREQYHEAIGEIEKGLGLTGQPRAVVFHVKDGREHGHVVWSRIDLDQMKAIQMSHDRSRLMDLACRLSHRFGFELPEGLRKWEAKQAYEKPCLEASQAENAYQAESGISLEGHRAQIKACFNQADGPEAFRAALEEKGYVLAQGDRRDIVVVDLWGKPYSLTRMLRPLKAKEVRAQLEPLTPSELPRFEEAKALQAQRLKARAERSEGKSGEGEEEGQRALDQMRALKEQHLAQKFAEQRTALRIQEQELLIRQQEERLSLHAAQRAESQGLLFKVRTGVADLIRSTPSLRSVLEPLQKRAGLDPRQRHQAQSKALNARHDRERADFARQERFLGKIEVREKQALEKATAKADRIARGLAGQSKRDFSAAAGGEAHETASGDEGQSPTADLPDTDESLGAKTSWADRAERLRGGVQHDRGKGQGFKP